MNRRQVISMAAMAALVPRGTALAATGTQYSGKKGIGTVLKTGQWRQVIQGLRCQWLYTWMPAVPDRIPENVNYVPMIPRNIGADAVVKAGQAAKVAGIGHLLGYNEPDESTQGNMTVAEALALWPALEETGLRLGSPACVQPDNDWMREFMKEAGKRKFRVDFVCVHSYGDDDASKLAARLEKIHKLYDRPLWITEFAVGDWKAKSAATNRYKPDDVLKFMEKILPKLEKLDFLERYAWFPAKPDNRALGSSALFDEAGALTRLGECYRDA